jgi:hypothetical protein
VSLKISFGAKRQEKFLPPSAAEFYIESTPDSLILRSKINESSVGSNYYLARSAVKKPFYTIAKPSRRSRGCAW